MNNWRWFRLLVGCLFWVAAVVAEPFTVVVYNLENFFDADGVAVYDDYQPAQYTPRHLATKARNAASILSRFRGGRGPDIVLLQEVEIDQTPSLRTGGGTDWEAFWRDQPAGTLESIHRGELLEQDLADLPAEAWLVKALGDAGIRGYQVVVGSDRPSPPGSERGRAIKCVTLSRFPVVAVREHGVDSARNILETQLDVQGVPLWVFNNHWKSGASAPLMEEIRVQNASVLRERVDAILRDYPQADIVIGGDLNSHYNQKPRYQGMVRTGINTVLGSQGDERALVSGERDLYNLWFELEPAARGSDTYRGEWGTLMHLIVSRGLYDMQGVQYQDGSFGVARIDGVNVDAAGVPRRWDSGGPVGSGHSDHLPLYAHFETVNSPVADAWIPLQNPSVGITPVEAVRVDYAGVDLRTTAVDGLSLPVGTDLRDGTWNGRLLKVKGQSLPGRNLQVQFAGEVYDIYAPGRDTRDALEAQRVRGRTFEFYGELGTFRGNWQFVVRDVSWVQ